MDHMRPAEAAKYLGISERTLQSWRIHGGDGPPFVRMGCRIVRYRKCDLEAYVQRHLQSTTNDRGHLEPSDGD